jgi:DNA-binding response OmpR family regulator
METACMNSFDDQRAETVTVGDLHLDPASGNAWWQATPLDLHPSEFRLLLALASRAGHSVSSDRLAHAVWGSVTKASAAYLALYITYLQRKLEANRSRPRVLRAVRGGYRLSFPQPPASRSPVWWLLRPG